MIDEDDFGSEIDNFLEILSDSELDSDFEQNKSKVETTERKALQLLAPGMDRSSIFKQMTQSHKSSMNSGGDELIINQDFEESKLKSRLMSMKLNEICKLYKMSSQHERDIITSVVENETQNKNSSVAAILKSLSNLSRFNSPAIKLKSFGNDSIDYNGTQSNAESSPYVKLNSLNTFIKNVCASNKFMDDITEEEEEGDENVTKTKIKNRSKSINVDCEEISPNELKPQTKIVSNYIPIVKGLSKPTHKFSKANIQTKESEVDPNFYTKVYRSENSLNKFLDKVDDRYNDFSSDEPAV